MTTGFPRRGEIIVSPGGTKWFVVEHPETQDLGMVSEWGKWYDTIANAPKEFPDWFRDRYMPEGSD